MLIHLNLFKLWNIDIIGPLKEFNVWCRKKNGTQNCLNIFIELHC